MKVQKWLPWLLLTVTLVLYAVWLAFPITIITADIGRHVADGRILFGYPELRGALLHTNFYSSSNPDFAIINHHWAAGLLFAAVQTTFGWPGLHMFAILLCIAALLLVLDVARSLSSSRIACVTSLLLLPMLAYRHEVRPEFIAYVLLGSTLWILHAVCRRNVSGKYLFALPFLLLLWVNVHASFPVGIALIGLFTADALLRKQPTGKLLAVTFLLSCLATLLNPAGFAGVLYPFGILQDPGYAVLENQSFAFLATIGVKATAFTYLKIVSVLLPVAIGILAYGKKLVSLLPHVIIAILVVLMGWLAVRHITLATFLLIPVFAAAVSRMTSVMKQKTVLIVTSVLIVFGLGFQGSLLRHRWITVGLEPGANAAAEFMKEHGIAGPLFNNFDIGGYVVYHFFPEIRPFVYNRPESHPADFWRHVYVPMMQDDLVWRQQLVKYGFNAIILFHGDRTTWAQEFLVARIRDPEWAAVFVNQSIIVFVRRNETNAKLIEEFGIPPASLLK